MPSLQPKSRVAMNGADIEPFPSSRSVRLCLRLLGQHARARGGGRWNRHPTPVLPTTPSHVFGVEKSRAVDLIPLQSRLEAVVHHVSH